MPPLPLDTSCEAEYADGYVHSETTLDDVSPFEDGKNVFYDILEKRPTAVHGQLVRFSVFYRNKRYDVDWTDLPESARPIRLRDGFNTINTSGQVVDSGWSGMRFGYQYNDEAGRNHQEILDL